MLNVCSGTVTEVLERRTGLDKLMVAPDEEPEAVRRAMNYHALCGVADRGEHVILNTTAVDLGLGTGGWDFVIANLSRLEEGPSGSYGGATPGHLMKLRYTPHQIAVQSAEEAYPDLPQTLDGRPVVAAELHSQLAPILTGLRCAVEAEGRPYPRVAYLMPDTAALPLPFSETVPHLVQRGLIHSTVTCGQAFGGDYEAVSLGSGLLIAAGAADCDVLVVAQGPGNAGTGSALGFGGLYCAEALHLAVALGGDPVLAARVSAADPRPRHQGLSHHSRTLLERILLVPVTVGLPDESGAWSVERGAWGVERDADGERGGKDERGPVTTLGGHHRIERAPGGPLLDALRESGLPLFSMGRGLDEDPAFFQWAASAGWVAGHHQMARAAHKGDDN